MMMIGQHDEESEKERKARKSQLYKQMLDNQILMNEHYRREHIMKSRQRDLNQYNEELFVPTIIYKQPEELQNSIVRQIEPRQQRSRSNFLPFLKDKNTFYRGSSKFLKVEEGAAKSVKETKRTYTQKIEQEDEEESDQYNSTCQRIIKQLQSIKTKPVKFRARRRVYDLSQMQAHRRGYDRTKSNSEKQQLPQFEQKVSSLGYQSAKQAYDSDQRYNQFISGNFNSSAKHQNQFQESPKVEKPVKKVILLPQFKSAKANQREANAASVNSGQQAHSFIDAKNQVSREQNSNDSRYANRKNQKSYQDITGKKERVQYNSLVNNRKKQSPLLSPLPSRYQQNTEEGDVKKKQESSRLARQRWQSQRQHFLQLLRKVKNRGQSLFVKLSKFPADKSSQKC